MRRPTTLCLLIALPLLIGCGGGVDERKFSRLKVGMTSQDVEAVLGKGGKEITSDELTTMMREALAPKPAEGKAAGPKLEMSDLTGVRGVRWGDESKSITVIFSNDRVSRLFKKGF
ncbi:MAG TPA: hypothetical protein VHR66_27960 [Gemmataceae bacterium]|jgi:hypothetical protein|nr:hypothetical protein [Gemmataceae bacterium]